jgi:hypothetical protein
MATMLIDKPSRLHNLSYLLLGYYLSSALTYSLDLSIEQRILVITALGSFIGALVYYIKPIEQILSTAIRIRKKNEVWPPAPNDEFSTVTRKTDVLMSSYLADERTKINGAFFLALGIISSYTYFAAIGHVDWYYFLQSFTFLLFVIGTYESYVLLDRKLPIVVSFYMFYNISHHTEILKKAIQKKDWIEADKIREKEPDLDNEYGDYLEWIPDYGVCLDCERVMERSHCKKCGKALLIKCPRCKDVLIREKTEDFPYYCRFCGQKLKEKISSS